MSGRCGYRVPAQRADVRERTDRIERTLWPVVIVGEARPEQQTAFYYCYYCDLCDNNTKSFLRWLCVRATITQTRSIYDNTVFFLGLCVTFRARHCRRRHGNESRSPIARSSSSRATLVRISLAHLFDITI